MSFILASIIEAGGNVLLPVHSGGVIFDLLELVSGQIKENFPRVSLYFVSKSGEASLSYANISAEWFVDLLRAHGY